LIDVRFFPCHPPGKAQRLEQAKEDLLGVGQRSERRSTLRSSMDRIERLPELAMRALFIDKRPEVKGWMT
jgi:hypothetical protein